MVCVRRVTTASHRRAAECVVSRHALQLSRQYWHAFAWDARGRSCNVLLRVRSVLGRRAGGLTAASVVRRV